MGDARCDCEGEIKCFLRWCNQPYVNYFDLSKGRADEIAANYFQGLQCLSEEAVGAALRVMRQSIEQNGGLPGVTEWKKCCTGVADYLLTPRDLEGRDRVAVAGASND